MSEAKFTKGPWGWFGNASTNQVYLATKDRGRIYVMGFERWGMRNAQPSFQPTGQGLVPAKDLLKFEVGDNSLTGVEAARKNGSVYRYDISGIDNPDARLIAAAPELYEALEWALDELLRPVRPDVEALYEFKAAMNALKKARGEV